MFQDIANVDNTMPMWSRAKAFNRIMCGDSYQCWLTPEEFVASYTGINYPIKSITYTYIDKPVAVMEY